MLPRNAAPAGLVREGTDEYGDPMPQWNELVIVGSVEAGETWPHQPGHWVANRQGQDRLSLPLRRVLRGKPMFRQVSTELATAANRDEPVRIEVKVKPGQGYRTCSHRVCHAGVFTTCLDWRTMEECDEPKPPPFSYLPGVSRILPDEQMFNNARPALEAALHALRQNSSDVIAIDGYARPSTLLNKWPLAHNVEQSARAHRFPRTSCCTMASLVLTVTWTSYKGQA